MQNVFFVIVGLAQLGIAIYGTMQMRKHFNWYALLVLIVVYGLAYDNLVIASGAVLGEGDLLKTINAPRFWVHALFTPRHDDLCIWSLAYDRVSVRSKQNMAHHHLRAGNCLDSAGQLY